MTTTAPHATDYGWLRERHAALRESYCVTLAGALTPADLLEALGAEPGPRIAGVAGLFEPSFDAWSQRQGDELFVGVAAVGDWSLMVEVNGYLGVTSSALRPLSRGRTIVAHHRNIDAVDHFVWLADGELLLHFEPLSPYRRDGSRADGFLVEMRESGFRLDPDAELDDRNTEAAFALAERITGVRLTAELLDSLEFTCGTAPVR
jgi:hypothetical protein